MRTRDLLIQLGGALAFSTLFEIVYAAFHYFTKRKPTPPPERSYEVLFFPDTRVACPVHFTIHGGCPGINCWYSHEPTSLMRLKQSLDNARRTVDVCVYTLTSQDLGDLILSLNRRGVYVRVIIDDEQVDVAGSQVKKFRSSGIEVRHDDSSFFMHHKFAVIDGTMLVNGSFNWSRQAIFGNNENIFLTNDANVVALYMQEFNKLWDLFDPARRLQAVAATAAGDQPPPAPAQLTGTAAPALEGTALSRRKTVLDARR